MAGVWSVWKRARSRFSSSINGLIFNYDNFNFRTRVNAGSGSGQEGSFRLHLPTKDRFLRINYRGCADAIWSRQGMAAITPTAERPIAAGAGAMGQFRKLTSKHLHPVRYLYSAN
jgi:hypothetical protein